MKALLTPHAFDDAIMRDPRPFDDYFLDNAPVYWDDQGQFFLVSSHALVTEVLRDNERFSSEYLEKFLPEVAPHPDVGAIYAQGCPFTKALLVTDGELHKRHRRIISKALSPAKVKAMMPAIESRISALLDELMPHGRMRFRTDFAEHVPIHIMQEILRIPDCDLEKAMSWSMVVTSGFAGLGKSLERQKADAAAVLEFQRYFQTKIEDAPDDVERLGEDDLCVMLGRAVRDPDDPMTMAEALSFLLILIPATHDTTAGSMTSCMKVFTDLPEVQARLENKPEAIPDFVNEAMRLDSPNRAFWRRVTCDTRLGAVHMPAGSWLLVRLTAANHDPSVYSDPYSFNMDRKGEASHLEFGTGVHMCIGRPIALLIISTTIRALIARGRNYRYIPGENNFEKEKSLLFSGYKDIAIQFDLR